MRRATAIKTAATSQQVREPTRQLDKAERRDELLDSELDVVTGGRFRARQYSRQYRKSNITPGLTTTSPAIRTGSENAPTSPTNPANGDEVRT